MESFQQRLPGFLPPPSGDYPLIPVRMVTKYFYCSRLAYLIWVQREWSQTLNTIEDKGICERADKKNEFLSALDFDSLATEESIYKSVTLSSKKLGIVDKINFVETRNKIVAPVDYKHGKRPDVPQGTYLPERVQICAQGMLLEEHGYSVEDGYIYFSGSRERVKISFDDTLRLETETAISELRLIVMQGILPPPLRDSPKCPQCALVTVCLPDEVNALRGSQLAPRPIAVPRDDALPLVIQSQGARITKAGETLVVTDGKGSEKCIRLIDISDVALFGNVSISPQAFAALFDREIPVSFHSVGGWFRGIAQGIGHKNAEIRTAQYRASFNEVIKLTFSKELMAAKIFNQRTMIRRNFKGNKSTRNQVLDELNKLKKQTSKASTISALMGIEGKAASFYFSSFSQMLDSPKKQDTLLDRSSEETFKFTNRNRRPPKDPVNAMLSFGYAVLTRQLSTTLAAIGLDPFRGLFHASRYGRPSLALDMMEPFRPIIVDSIILRAVNTGEISPKDFTRGEIGVALTQNGRRKFLNGYERRMSDIVTHPIFGYRLSLRRMLIVQARLFSRYLLDEIPSYPHYCPR